MTDSARNARLDAELDKGSGSPLPPNHPQGVLGETGGFDLLKREDYAPDGSSGVSQEIDAPVQLLGVMLAYFVFFPLGFWLLWRSPLLGRRTKWGLTFVGVAGVAAATFILLTR